MTIQVLLEKLQLAGIQLRRSEGGLAVSGDRQTLDTTLLRELRTHRDALLEMIDGDDWWSPAVIRPEMLTLVELSQAEIDRVVAGVEGGARNVQDIYPLAPLQEGVLFHHLASTEGDPFLRPRLSSFATRGELDAYLAALQAVVNRHDILRTSVAWEGLREPVQVVWRQAALRVQEVELDPAAGEVARQLYDRFDPRHHRIDVRRAPMLAIYVAHDPERDRWILLRQLHHLVVDQVTQGVLHAEVEAHLAGRADELPPPLPFRNYVAQARLGVTRQEHEAYFRALLGDVDEPTAPFGLLDAWGDGSGIAEGRLAVEGALAARLREQARRMGMTPASVVHLAWAQVLARVSGRADVVFGTVLVGRMHGGEGSDRVLGPFINTLPVRVRVGSQGAAAGVRGMHAQLAELLRHEHASLALAQRCSGVAAPAPLFSALLNYRTGGGGRKAPPSPLAGTREVVRGIPGEGWASYPVALLVDDRGQGFDLMAQAPASVGPERVCAMVHRALEGLVEALETAPERPVARIEVLPEAERARVVEAWNATEAEYPAGSCAHELFQAQAARTPEAPALVHAGGTLAYAELNARANRLAHHLVKMGVGPDVRVGLCLERGPEMVVALLAVLKAGGAYVPLDPEYPEARLRYMLADSAPAVLLTQSSLRARFAEAGVPLLAVDADAAAWGGEAEADPDRGGLTAEHLAYVIYTSGSTGQPKGVMVPHRGLVNYLWFARGRYVDGDGPVTFPLYSSLSFDLTVTSVFLPLITGGSIVVPPNESGDRSILRVFEDDAVDVVKLTPSHLVLLAQHDLKALRIRTLVVGGEDLKTSLAQSIHAASGGRLRIENEYGPTEATVGCVVRRYDADADADPSVPIGTPIPNMRAYVLDRSGEPVPAGVAGELFLGGAGIARGYLDRPRLTAERFVPDPFGGEPGARLYRTGDLARWREVRACERANVRESHDDDGSREDASTFALSHSRAFALEFLGRGDDQVKVRGFRIEPGEIEARLAEHAGVREAVVVVREDAPGDRALVAYYVAEDAPVGVEALRAHLAERLPEHMVPAAYVAVKAWPLTPNGKLDRGALPAPGDDARARPEHEALATPMEVAVAEIWAKVLGVERVGRHDDFFKLGGHSLRAVQVVSRVRQALGIKVSLGQLFDRRVLADFARALEEAGRARLPPIEPVDRDGPLALSFAQQRLWFLEQLGGMGATYHIPRRLRMKGPLDRDALRRALDRIIARHEALRTTFRLVDGRPEQLVAPAESSRFHLVEHDLSADLPLSARNERGGGRGEGPEAELRRLVSEEGTSPFDLARGPLIRGRLIRLGADDHVLLMTMHHVVSDAWSMAVLVDELTTLYGAFLCGEDDPLPPLALQYADYAAWQRRWVEGEVLEAQAAYWTKTLADAPELLELPMDRPRPARPDHAGATVRVELDEALTAGLKALSQRHGTTLFMTLLAGWAAVLGRLSGQDDVVVGTPAANRDRREVEGLIGFFINTLALRVDLSAAPTVAALLQRVKARSIEAQQNADIPFEQVVERVQAARSLAHTPLFQVLFAWQNAPRGRLELPGLELGPVPGAGGEGTAKFDLTLSLGESNGQIVGGMTYATALFDRARVERYAGYLLRVLEAMVAGDARAVASLPMLPEAERAQVVESWNATDAEYPAGACVHELFEAQAARTPNAVALVHEGGTATYAELNASANRLAHHLAARGVGPDVPVGLCLERGPEMIVALLAVLKAGGVYVPLDPEYPEDRLRYMLADAAPAVVLTQASLDGLFAGSEVPRIRVDADAADWADAPTTNPARGALTPDHLAYVIYTSGSTGQPKGVMNQHRTLVNRLAWGREAWGIEADDAVLCKTSLNFDGSVREIFLPLMAGARIVLARPGGHRDPSYLLDAIGREGITTVNLVPSLLQVLLEADAETPPLREERAGRGPRGGALRALKRILCGGEALPAAVLERFREQLPDVELHNLYGPSEAATAVAAPRCVAEPGRASVPIGGPIANTRVYVLDGAGEPVPVGVAGELYIGGVPVARGYRNRPALTAERFVPDPFAAEPGARLYRTGDVVRWLEDGRLEFVGRNDAQVKVRGFRVEPGEIEARLREHGGIREAVVIAREDVPGDRRLVAYVVGDGSIDAEALRAHLSARLPEYMVPAAYVRLDALPLTPSGKVDRRALPAPEGDAYARRGYEAPGTPVEAALAEVWSSVLRVERVGRNDDFFQLGGHSLLAVQVISRVRQVLGVEAALGEIFARPVLADFARGVEESGRAALPPIEPADRRHRLPLSFAQQRLWFLEQLGGAGSAYHVPKRLRLRGPLDRDALVRALDRIVARHEVLRTAFPVVRGEPVQRITRIEESRFHLVEHDLSGVLPLSARNERGEGPEAEVELRRLAIEEANAPFDLARGPLIRGRLIRLADDDHVLLLTMHHVVADAWSMGVLIHELGTLYAAFRAGEGDPLPPLAVQYADYAVWQRRWMEGEVLEAQAAFWTRRLAGAPELLELPADRPRPAQRDHAGSAAGLVLDPELTAALRTLSQRHGTTLFMTILAGWSIVLGRLSGQEDVVVGTPTANRGRREIEGLIGFFLNTLALRLDLSGAPSVAELLGRVKERVLEAQANQDIPFEQVVERVGVARSMAHSPVFQVNFTWLNAPRDSLRLPGLELGPAAGEPHVSAKVDLSLVLREAEGRIVGGMEYATSLFDRATIDRHLEYLRRVLREMAADDARAADRIPLLPEEERRQVVERWNATDAAYPHASCIHELVEAQAARTPDAAAVVDDGGALTYAALNARANRLAHYLRAHGVGPDARVGICVERGAQMVVALLAVLKAGGAYVPLDPAYPDERLRYMLADSAPVLLLTQASLLGRFASAEAPRLCVDADAPAWTGEAETNPARGGVTPRHLAYVIYTSGSTGRPKGVMVEHRGACNLVSAQAPTFGVEAESRVLQFASFSFDACVSEVLMALCTGAALHLPPRGAVLAGETLLRALDGITHVTLPPAVLATFPEDAALDSVRTLVLAGDVLPEAVAKRWAPGRRLVNAYGPTEASVCATLHEIRAGDAGTPPIGRPIANARVYVLDRAGEPVPVGVSGELYVGGAGIARGYLDRPALTAERFVPDPFAAEPGARLYRTGDLARWKEVRECESATVRESHEDGSPRENASTFALSHSRTFALEFLGRNDFQVKVRGFRIEPGEIEARLAEVPGVREAVVLARKDAPGQERLVAYVVADEGAADADGLRAHLSARLPEYMVPAAFVRLDALPLSPNGKLDRAALPAPEAVAVAAEAYEAPATATETALAEIWAELLELEAVGRHDDFFELGGHSLLAAQVVARIRQVLGVEAALDEVFERPTLADFARALDQAARAGLPPIEPVDRAGPVALSFAQQRLWFLERLGGLGSTYHVPMRLRLRGALDRDALVRTLERIVARHEVLRTTFGMVDGEPVQVIAPAEESGFRLVEDDLSADLPLSAKNERDPGPQAELRRLIAGEARAPFDLERGPLFRARLIRLAADDHVLLITMHHVVSDGWSLGVLIDELGTLYGAFHRGEPDPLPPLPVQYADYAAWQRRWVDGEVLESQAAYWTRALADAPELLELPTDHARPPRQEFAGASVRVALDDELTAGLRALGQRHGTTLFMTLMAGWATVLGRLAGQEDVVVGTPTANRARGEVEGLIGFFVNTLALRVDLSDSPTVAELLERVKARSLEAQQNQDIPFEQVVERVQPARSLAHSPVFQVVFSWQNTPRERLHLAGLELAPVPGGGDEAAKFDLSLSLAEADGQIRGGITYATSLFERATVERYAGYLARVLREMTAGDARRVDQLPMLPDDERRRVVEEWSATGADASTGLCVHEIFQAQAARTPGAVAVVQGEVTLTYAELNARANRLAHHLRKRGVGPDVRVGLCVERTPELVVGLMAILKAGGAYVPLDPEYPEERLRYMLADSGPAALLTRASLAGRFAEAGVPLVRMDADASAWADEPATDPARGALTPDHLAYVIYTSGSTGRPKGTEVPHRAIPGFFRGVDYVRFDAEQVLLQHSSVSWDALTLELFPAILTGGRCVLYPGWTHDPAALAREIRAHGVTTMWISAALFNLVLDTEPEMLAGVRQVMVGGEAVSAAHVKRALELYPEMRLVNGYGPSECTVFASCQVIAPDFDAPTVPIGRPVGDRRVYLLDRRMEPVAPGSVGELYVGGPAVARGYRGRPALTAERFVPDPFGAPGARLYRSGDRVRWREARACERAKARKRDDSPGEDDSREDAVTLALSHSRAFALEFVERADHQVKVRGFRVELGEIEVQLSGHPAVRDVVVVAREDAPGDRRLVAYFAGDDAGAEELRAYLSARLPEYMVPSAYVRLDALPLTAHGKVDRRALPAPEADAFAASVWVAPVGPVEEALAEIWAELLGVDRVSRNDNFFRLGGHSLKAVRLIERMRRRGLHAEVGALFTTATLAELAASVGGESFEVQVPANAIPPGCDRVTPQMLPLVELTQAEIDGIVARIDGGAANLQDVYPLAPLQEGILFHHLRAAEGDPYLVGTLSSFDTRERLDAYLAALQAVVDRHDILRTSVMWEGLREPVQVVSRRVPLPVEEVELDPADGDVARQLYARFNPRHHRIDVRRAPLVRVYAARDAERDRWLLLLLEHHLVSDHTTQDVLQEEIRAHLLGQADALPAPMPFRNYVAQARLGVSRAEHEAYFRGRLAEVDEPTAPFGLLDVWGDGSGTAEARMPVDAALAARLREQARRLGVSAASVFHVAWAQVLGRASGRDDVVFGTVLFGRMHGGDGSDRVMGPFINTLPVRVPLASAGVEESVRAMHRQLTELLRHEHASLALAQRCSGVAAPAPLFTSYLNFRHSQAPADVGAARAARARAGIRKLHSEARSNYPVSLSVDDRGDGFALMTLVPASVGPERVCGMVHRALEGLVDALENAPGRPVIRVEVLPDAERAQVVDGWNATDAEYPAGACVHELFEAQAARAPNAVALVHEGGTATYAELNASANRLAHHLAARGVGPDVPVGLCLERGPEMIVALLAVLKAGGVYVPLDPEYPEDRLRYMLGDSAPAVLLTQASLDGLFAGSEVPRIRIDADAADWADQPETNPARGALTPDHLAYVIYTSGSTGQPKGVMNQHRTLVNRLAWGRQVWGMDADDAVLCKTSLNFDGSVREIFLPLMVGARVVLARPGGHRDPSYLLEVIGREGITTVNLVPSLLPVLLEAPEVANLRALKRVLCGGEALPAALLERFRERLPEVELHNLYGPSEAATAVTSPRCTAVAGLANVPIGGPIANTRVYVLDGAGEPVPVGVAGELYIGGVPVARGYRNRPALTAERFVPDPFAAEPGARLYRTGDVVRWLEDGRLEFVGRNDAQVKVRGFRVELGEIEARLRENPAVREAVAIAREDVPGDRRLVAYLVGDESIEAEALRAHLAARLPEYMVPAAYVRLDALPLTPSGKLDRRALPAPEGGAYARRGYEAPAGETETALAAIWADVLRVERIGRRDSFFELGGHSLTAVQLVARVRQALGVEVALADVFHHPTLEALAARIGGGRRQWASDRAIPLRPAGTERPLFVVHEGMGSVAYAQVLHPHVDPAVPVYALPAPGAAEPRPRTVEGMAARLARMVREVQPTGPYRLAGWSFGGILAYEVAAQLMGQDQAVEFVGIVDTHLVAGTRVPPRTRGYDYGLLLSMLRLAELGEEGGDARLEEEAPAAAGMDLETFVRRCREKGLLPGHVTAAQAREMQDRLWAHRDAMRGWFPQPLPIPVHLFPARESADPDLHRGWQALLPDAAMRVVPVPGTHLSMMEPGNVAALGEALSAALRGAGTGRKAPQDEYSPLVTLRFGKGGEPLFCVPGAGASAASFTDLAGCLDPARPVHAFQPRGLDGTMLPHTTVAAAAASYLQALERIHPTGPVHLLGHSFGGWVALEMATRLAKAGRDVASLTILDSEVPGQEGNRTGEYDAREAFLGLVEVFELTAERSLEIASADVDGLDEDALLALLHGRLVPLGLLPRRSEPEVLRGTLRTFAAALRATWTPIESYPYPLDLVLLADSRYNPDTNQLRMAETVRQWRRWAPRLAFSTGAGSHVSALKQPYVKALAAYLDSPRLSSRLPSQDAGIRME